MITLIFPASTNLPVKLFIGLKNKTKMITPTKSSLTRLFRLQRRGIIVELSQFHSKDGLDVTFVRPSDISKIRKG